MCIRDRLGDAEADGILACLSKQQEISDYFAPMFEAFEQEDYKTVRNFIVTDQYKACLLYTSTIKNYFVPQRTEWYAACAAALEISLGSMQL